MVESCGLPMDRLTIIVRGDSPETHSERSIATRLWRGVALAWPLLLLGVHGCTDLSRSSADAVRMATHRHPQLALTAAEVNAKPFFQLEASGPDGSAVLILGNLDGQREAWYGAHETIVFIEHGRVVQTAGLKQNLDGLQLPANDPFIRGLHTITTPVDYRRSEDWSPDYRYDVQVDARLIPAGREQISILGTTHEVLRVDEQINAPAAHYRATNHYWVDPQDGFVWKSEQQVTPGLTLKFVQLRPYRVTQP